MSLRPQAARRLLATSLAGLALASTVAAEDLLIISSGDADDDASMVAAMTNGGHDVTLGPMVSLFDGATELDDYDAVLVLGRDYAPVMPEAGQLALRDYVQGGGGLITAEWLVWSLSASADPAPLLDILPSESSVQFDALNPLSVRLTDASAPIDDDLPVSFTFDADFVGGSRTILNPRPDAQVMLRFEEDDAPALIGWQIGEGRVLSFAMLLGDESIANPAVSEMVNNAVEWVSSDVLEVLLLGSGISPDIDALAREALLEGGHSVDMDLNYLDWAPAGLALYDVIVMPGHVYSGCDFPEASQQALVDFVNAGGGLVTCEWFSWMYPLCGGTVDTLGSILPAAPGANDFFINGDVTYAQVTPDATLNAGLPESFTFTADDFAGTEASMVAREGAIRYYASAGIANADGVIGWPVGDGRVMSLSTVYGELSLANADYRRLLGNAVAWSHGPVAAPCPGDLDGDGMTGIGDLLGILAAWGVCENCPADLSGDGMVGIADLLAILASWGPCS